MLAFTRACNAGRFFLIDIVLTRVQPQMRRRSLGASPVRDDAPRAFMRCARHGAEGRRPQDADMRGMVLFNVREDILPDGFVQNMRVLHPLRQGREQRKGVRAHCILYGLRQHHL